MCFIITGALKCFQIGRGPVSITLRGIAAMRTDTIHLFMDTMPVTTSVMAMVFLTIVTTIMAQECRALNQNANTISRPTS